MKSSFPWSISYRYLPFAAFIAVACSLSGCGGGGGGGSAAPTTTSGTTSGTTTGSTGGPPAPPVGISGSTTSGGTTGVPAPPPISIPTNGLAAYWPGEGNAMDMSGNNNNGVAYNGVSYTAGQVGQAFTFDGNLRSGIQVVDSPSLKIIGAITVSAWIKFATFPLDNANGEATIVFRGDDRPGLDPYKMYVTPQGTVRFHIESETAQIELEAPIPQNTWVMVTGTLDDSGDIRLYINAQLAKETLTTVRPLADLVGIGGLGIGHHPGLPDTPFDYQFNGKIDEIRIYNRALSDQEVLNIYRANGGL